LWKKKKKKPADFIAIEGPMAGGHLGFHKEQLEEFTPDIYGEEVKKAFGNTKVCGKISQIQ